MSSGIVNGELVPNIIVRTALYGDVVWFADLQPPQIMFEMSSKADWFNAFFLPLSALAA